MTNATTPKESTVTKLNKEQKLIRTPNPQVDINTLLCTVPQSTVTEQHGCQSFGCGLKLRGFGIGAAIGNGEIYSSRCPPILLFLNDNLSFEYRIFVLDYQIINPR